MNISYRWHHIPVVATSRVMIELQAYCTKSLPLYQLSKGRELQPYCTVLPPYLNEISTRSVGQAMNMLHINIDLNYTLIRK